MERRILLVLALLLCAVLTPACCGAVALTYQSSVGLPSYASDVCVSGNYAYVATYNGLQILDVTSPGQPRAVGSCAIAGADSITVQGNYAYVACDGGMAIVDVTTRTAPKVTATYSPGDGEVIRICVSENYAYLQFRDNSYYNVYYLAVNVSNHSSPQPSGSCSDGTQTNGLGSGLALYGNTLYGTQYDTLSMIDVTDPMLMIQTNASSSGYEDSDLCVNDAYLYLAGYFDAMPPPPYSTSSLAASGYYGLYLKIKNHDAVEYSYFSVPDYGTLKRVFSYGKYAFVSYETGVTMVDISNPFNPTLAAKCTSNGTAQGMAASGDYLYVADGTGGLSVYKISGTTVGVNLVVEPEMWEYANLPIQLIAFGYTGKSAQYKFLAGSTVLRDFSSETKYTWKPTTAGTFNLTVVAKDAAGNTVTSPAVSYQVVGQVQSVSIAASPASPQPLGSTIKLTATAVGGVGLKYYFYDGSTRITRTNDTLDTYDWTPTTTGVHSLSVWAVDEQNNTVKSTALNYAISPSIQSVSLAASPEASCVMNTPITFTATATGGTEIQYKFLAGGTYVLRDFASSNTATWKFTSAGTRQITVVAKDSNGKTVTSDPYYYDVLAGVSSVSLAASPTAQQYANQPVTFTATAVGGSGIQYKFLSGGSYVIRDFAASNTAQFTYTSAGVRQITVVAKDAGGNTVTSDPLSYTILAPLTGVSVSASPVSPQQVGTKITFTATAVGGNGVTYKFLAGGSYVLRDFASSNTMDWTFNTAGTRQISVVAKDSSGKTVTSPTINYTITSGVQSASLTANPTSPLAGQQITLTAASVGGTGIQYKFVANGSYVLRNFSSSNTMTYTFATAGTRPIYVVAKDSDGKTVSSPAINVVVRPSIQSVSVSANPASPVAGQQVTFTATAVGGEGIQYKFLANGSFVLRDYASSNTAAWTFATAGTRTITILAKDSNGKIVSKTISLVVAPAMSVNLNASPASPQPAGTTVTLTANVTGGTATQYKFLANGSFVLRDWAASNTATWKFTTAGTRTFTVIAKDANGKTATSPTVTYVISAP